MNDHSDPIPRDRVPTEIRAMSQQSANRLRVVRAALALTFDLSRRKGWEWAVLNAVEDIEGLLVAVQDSVAPDVTLNDLFGASCRLEADASLLSLMSEHGSTPDPPNEDIGGADILRGAAGFLDNEAAYIRRIAEEIDGAVKDEAA